MIKVSPFRESKTFSLIACANSSTRTLFSGRLTTIFESIERADSGVIRSTRAWILTTGSFDLKIA